MMNAIAKKIIISGITLASTSYLVTVAPQVLGSIVWSYPITLVFILTLYKDRIIR